MTSLMDTIERVGRCITKSQMFGCKSEEQGMVIALSCITTGRDILSVPEEYHLMNNKLSLQATAMLGRLVKCGGEYEVIAHSPQECTIKITYRGRHFTETITWEDAQEEPFVYAGKTSDVLSLLAAGPEARKQLMLSANYATPRRRMQHLWARVVSDSVRVIAPDLVSGVYTPEEVADYSGLVSPEPRTVEAIAVKPIASTVKNIDRSVIDPVATDDQIAKINECMEFLELPADIRVKSWEKRGCTGPEGLTRSQADDVLLGLMDRVAKRRAEQPSEIDRTVLNVNGPITQEYRDQLQDKIKQLAQTSKDGVAVVEKIKEKLRLSGVKLIDLRYCDARNLMEELDQQSVVAFFDAQLLPVDQQPGEPGGGSS